MKIALALTLLTFISCQTYNANTFDGDKYAVTDLVGGQNFRASYKILQNRCMNCHTHGEWAAYKNTQDWVSRQSLVISGDPDQSSLIFRIINHGGAVSDMPQGGQALPDAEFQTLVDWVTDTDS